LESRISEYVLIKKQGTNSGKPYGDYVRLKKQVIKALWICRATLANGSLIKRNKKEDEIMRNLTLIAALTVMSCALGIARPGVSIAQNIVEEELESNRSGSRDRGNVGEDRRVRREDFRERG